MKTVMNIVYMFEGDIRACLNAIQFLSVDQDTKDPKDGLSMDKLKYLNVMKDVQKSLFGVWEGLFVIQTSKERRNAIIPVQENSTSVGSAATNVTNGKNSFFNNPNRTATKAASNRYIPYLHHLLSSSGEYPKIMAGCFENYLKTSFTDSSNFVGNSAVSSVSDNENPTITPNTWHVYEFGYRSRLEDVHEWIRFFDILDKKTFMSSTSQSSTGNGSGGEWDLGSYVPYSFMSFYRCLASAKKTSFDFPKVDYENYQKRKANELVLESVWSKADLKSKSTWGCIKSFSIECLPFLLRIISPEIRGTNINLLKKHEKRMLERTVDIMISYGLVYTSNMSMHGTMEYKLEPYFRCFPELMHRPIQQVIEEIEELGMGKYLHGSGILKQMILSEVLSLNSIY
jgi:chromosome transmission fidelity protein 18